MKKIENSDLFPEEGGFLLPGPSRANANASLEGGLRE